LWQLPAPHAQRNASSFGELSIAEGIAGLPTVQVVTYEGRAAVPLAPLLGGFQKAFFLQPRSLDLYGRVKVSPLPVLSF
jgi:hypothetical protein